MKMKNEDNVYTVPIHHYSRSLVHVSHSSQLSFIRILKETFGIDLALQWQHVLFLQRAHQGA